MNRYCCRDPALYKRQTKGMAMAARYYSPGDPESYITPSTLKRLSRAKQIEFMVHWFNGLFWDPANDTPHDSGEGGYQYIWGGPYDAHEELGDQFGGVVSDEVIEAAVEEVQSDGILDWAPTSQHPAKKAADEEAMAEHYDEPPSPSLDDIRGRLNNGVVPSFGDAYERQEREALRSDIAELREMLAQAIPQHGGMGHNHPPDDTALSVEITVNVTTALDEMDEELAKPEPDVSAVVESAGKLEIALAWIAKKLDKTVDSFMNAIGTAAGVAVGAQLAGVPVAEKVGQVLNASVQWLDNVTLPF